MERKQNNLALQLAAKFSKKTAVKLHIDAVKKREGLKKVGKKQ